MVVGTIANAINAQGTQLYITATTNTYALLQNSRMLISHPIIREPTTDAGVALFTGAPDVSISGTLLFTEDTWNLASHGLAANLIKSTSTGEVPAKLWGLIAVSKDTTSFKIETAGGKLSVVDISKSVEGGVKVDISIILPAIPTLTGI